VRFGVEPGVTPDLVSSTAWSNYGFNSGQPNNTSIQPGVEPGLIPDYLPGFQKQQNLSNKKAITFASEVHFLMSLGLFQIYNKLYKFM
jgi:hypothetical protein